MKKRKRKPRDPGGEVCARVTEDVERVEGRVRGVGGALRPVVHHRVRVDHPHRHLLPFLGAAVLCRATSVVGGERQEDKTVGELVVLVWGKVGRASEPVLLIRWAAAR